MNQLNELFKNNIGNKKIWGICLKQNFFDKLNISEIIELLKEKNIDIVLIECNKSLEEAIDISSEFIKSDIAVIIQTNFNKCVQKGLNIFSDIIRNAGISAVRIPDLPFEEQGQLAVYLLDDEGPFLFREVTPASGDRIMQNMQFAKGCIFCSNEGNMDFLSGAGEDPLMFYMYAVEATAKLPVLLDFKDISFDKIKEYLEFADGALIGNELDKIFNNDISVSEIKKYLDSIKF